MLQMVLFLSKVELLPNHSHQNAIHNAFFCVHSLQQPYRQAYLYYLIFYYHFSYIFKCLYRPKMTAISGNTFIGLSFSLHRLRKRTYAL